MCHSPMSSKAQCEAQVLEVCQTPILPLADSGSADIISQALTGQTVIQTQHLYLVPSGNSGDSISSLCRQGKGLQRQDSQR